MPGLDALIDDLETALQHGEHERRIAMLRRVTNLFVDSAPALDENQVEVFGEVLTHLTRQLESKVLAELGEKLASVDNAPNAVIQDLARHHEIAVAGPVLSQSKRLTEGDLIEIASTRGQAHLGAISVRSHLPENVTDVLVERGDAGVVHTLTQNRGAAFSHKSFNTLTERAQTDEQLAVNLGMRVDVPPAMLRELMAKATDAVRARLSAVVPAGIDVKDVVNAASREMLSAVPTGRSMARAEALIAEMAASKKLNEQAVDNFAKSGLYEETLVAVARLCSAPTELVSRLMQNESPEGLLLACKAAGFEWPTVAAILALRKGRVPMSDDEIEAAGANFLRISLATAQRVLRFWLVRGVASRAH